MRNEPEMLKNRNAEAVPCGARCDQRAALSGSEWVRPLVQQAVEDDVWADRLSAGPSSEESDSDKRKRFRTYTCPACETELPIEMAAAPRPGLVCRCCHFQLWCRRQVSMGGVALEALPGPAPESWEINRVVGVLKRSHMPDRATLDLSRFEIMNSSWLASLVGLKRALQVCGCTLVLSGLRPYVREIFNRLHFETYFEIVRMREQD